jgi:DNA-binding NtrC family response regulator
LYFRNFDKEFEGSLLNEKTHCITGSLTNVYKQAFIFAQNKNFNVLIKGDTGTGKENLARYIHKASSRKCKPFITYNCGSALLVDSALFGHARGSFTGATENRKGIFESANGGTLFLDEIHNSSDELQQRLLKVVECGKFNKVGEEGKEPIDVDVNIIFATNVNLYDYVRRGIFREDLYYRICSSPLHLSCLRDYSRQDKSNIFEFLVNIIGKGLAGDERISVYNEVKDKVIQISEKGNFRLLKNIIEYFYTARIQNPAINDIPKEYLADIDKSESVEEEDDKLESVEKRHITKVYFKNKMNITLTSEALGVSYNCTKDKLKKHGLYELNVNRKSTRKVIHAIKN